MARIIVKHLGYVIAESHGMKMFGVIDKFGFLPMWEVKGDTMHDLNKNIRRSAGISTRDKVGLSFRAALR